MADDNGLVCVYNWRMQSHAMSGAPPVPKGLHTSGATGPLGL